MSCHRTPSSALECGTEGLAFSILLLVAACSATLACSNGETCRPVSVAEPAPPPEPALSGESSPQAEFVITYTGADRGILEPCGCTKGMLGGIGRRAALLQAIVPSRDRGLILSTGGLVDGTSGKRNGIDSRTINHLDRLRYETLLVALGEMGYAAAAIGPEELRLGIGPLIEAAEISGFTFLLTNVVIEGDDSRIFRKVCRFSLDIDRVEKPIEVAVLGMIAPSLSDELPAGVRLTPAGEALDSALGEGDPKADFHVLLLRGSRADARALSKQLPSPWLIVYSSPDSEPQVYEFGKQKGDARIVSPGDRGRFVGLSRIVQRPDGRWEVGGSRFEALGESLPESDIVRFPLEIYRERIGIEKVMESQLGTIPNRSGRAFRGSESCAECHPETYKIWKASRHAHAWATLKRAGRDYDPGCVSCHVTGFGIEKGFGGAAETPLLVDVGCEACHGPAGDHVVEGDPPSEGEKCAACHDHFHSPGFDRIEAWKKIACVREN